jgi:hypothetical protein
MVQLPPFEVIDIPLDCIIVEVAQVKGDFAKYARIAFLLELQHVIHLLLVHRTDLEQKLSDSIGHIIAFRTVLDFLQIFDKHGKGPRGEKRAAK